MYFGVFWFAFEILISFQVYRQLYAPNPFATETDEDIQKYIKEVEMKTSRPSSAAATEKPSRQTNEENSEVESPGVGQPLN